MAAPTPSLPKLRLRLGAWDEAIKTLAALKEGGLTVSNVVIDDNHDRDEEDEDDDDRAALLTEVYKVLVPGGTVDIHGNDEDDIQWYFGCHPTYPASHSHATQRRLFFAGRACDFAASDEEVEDGEDFDHNFEDIDAGVAALEAVDQTQALYLMSAGLGSKRLQQLERLLQQARQERENSRSLTREALCSVALLLPDLQLPSDEEGLHAQLQALAYCPGGARCQQAEQRFLKRRAE